MEVKSYTFQSPYPSSVQAGRADTATQQSEKSQEEATAQANKDTQELNLQTQTPTSQPDAPERLLDIYA